MARLSLADEQSYVHTAFFIGWVLERGLLSDECAEFARDDLEAYRRREMTAVDVYASWDGCLVDDQLDETGNAFAQSYFDFERGEYLADYRELLVRDRPSEFHVPYTWENQALMSQRIDERFRAWQEQRKGPSAR